MTLGSSTTRIASTVLLLAFASSALAESADEARC